MDQEPMRPDRPITWRELTADLVWPRLLESVRLALRPSRLGLAFVLIVVLMGLGTLFDWIRGPALQSDMVIPRVALAGEGEPTHGLFEATVRNVADLWSQTSEAVAEGNAALAILSVRDLLLTLPTQLATRFTLSAGILTLIVIILWCIGGGALCRMTAREVATGERVPMTAALAFVLPRWRRYLGALLGPAVAIAVIVLLLALGGFVLLRFPVVNVLGGALYGLFLLGGALVVFLGVGVALGGALLAPAVSVDAEDAFDAIQRAYSYVLAKPLRLFLYAIALLILGSIAYVIAQAAAGAILEATRGAAFAWAGGSEVMAQGGAALTAAGQAPALPEGAGWSMQAAAALVRLWELAFVALLASFAVSYLASASTLLYMCLRKVCDGEAFAEIAPGPGEDRAQG